MISPAITFIEHLLESDGIPHTVKKTDEAKVAVDISHVNAMRTKSVMPFYPTAHHVVQSPRGLQRRLSRHARDITYPGRHCQVNSVTASRTCPTSVTPDDVVEIAYTSGTTGLPKGVLTTHSQFLKAMAAMAGRLGTTDQDRVLLPAPMFTNMGNLVGIIQAEMYGAPMVVLELFDPPQILAAIRQERCSLFTGSPAMYNMIMDHPDFRTEDVRSMRAGIIGGAPVTPEIVRKVWEKIGMKLFVGYGMTENSAVTTLSEVDDTPELISQTCGRLLFHDCQMKIVDPETGRDCPPGVVGEIRTKGWLVTQGYYKMPEETAKSKDEEGWFRTGDLGTLDEKGYLRVTGRLKDMIISGGLNIDPVEIENLILQNPAVAAAQVVGVPDPRMGEVVMAFLILKKGMAATDRDIIDFCAGRIANYKVPKYVKFVEEFPVTAYGKVQKFKLRERATEEISLGK